MLGKANGVSATFGHAHESDNRECSVTIAAAKVAIKIRIGLFIGHGQRRPINCHDSMAMKHNTRHVCRAMRAHLLFIQLAQRRLTHQPPCLRNGAFCDDSAFQASFTKQSAQAFNDQSHDIFVGNVSVKNHHHHEINQDFVRQSSSSLALSAGLFQRLPHLAHGTLHCQKANRQIVCQPGTSRQLSLGSRHIHPRKGIWPNGITN